LECFNVIVILIKLSAFVGLNCNNWTIMHGMENVKMTGLIRYVTPMIVISQ